MRRLLKRWLGRSPAEAEDVSAGQCVARRAEAEQLIAEGNTLEDAGQLAEAEARYRAALKLCPDLARAYLNLGNVQAAQGQSETAAESYREALRLEPGYGAAHANLGKLYLGQNDYANAAEHYTAAVQALPESAEAWVGLGSALEETERRAEAVAAYQRALAIQPDFPGANLNLGRLFIVLKRLDEAAEQFESLLSAVPDHVLGHVLLGKIMSDMGFHSKGSNLLSRAIQLDPKNPDVMDLPLFTMNYLPDCPAEALFAAHVEYGRCFNAKFSPKSPKYYNLIDPERPLKIGYVSSDFKSHPTARFIEPVFIHHDRAYFEVHAFYTYHSSDIVTHYLKELVDAWHPIWGIEDEAAANQVHTLGIDILIDLTSHAGLHRFPIFARKSAPIQATWLGYIGTTGLLTIMDYRICDNYTDPPGLTERFHTEQLARLPDCQWCYMPLADLPPVGEFPQQYNDYLTLGSFNSAAKINERVLALWAEVLLALPNTKLCIAAIPSGRAQQRIISILSAAGVAFERLEFIPHLPYRDYLSAISKVDLALDPFPYNGGTTSFDTLIMGVPFVTLAGNHSIARGGVSILTNLGLTDLIATTPGEYVEIVRQLANNPLRLADLRRTLRQRLEDSPLMDGARFTRNLEALYRQMWQTWCDSQQRQGSTA